MTLDDELFKTAWPRVYAAAVRAAGGNFAVGEDATAEAFERAARSWEARPPDNPVGWLITAARRIVIDDARKQATQDRSAKRVAIPGDQDEVPVTSATGDDVLDLFITCAHPALSEEAQVALTLRAVAGLRPAEIARAFHCSPAAMEKRLVRARRKILEAGISFGAPKRADLAERLDQVMRSILLVFNEGYAPTAGDESFRQGLCDEAIFLARSLRHVVPDLPEPAALLATLLFIDSRRDARADSSGDLVPLRSQDRRRWNATDIAEAVELTLGALDHPGGGDYTLQAAIGALHAEAPSHERTNWAHIVVLYEQRLALAPSPTVAIAHAVAVAEAHSTAEARDLIEPMEPATEATRFLRLLALARFAEIDDDAETASAHIAAAQSIAPTSADARALDHWRDRLRSEPQDV